MNNLSAKIYRELLLHEDKKAAEADKKYHKYPGYYSLGIKAPVLLKLLKTYQANIRELSCREALTAADKLFQMKIEEAALAGNYVLQNRIDCLGKAQLPFLDKCLANLCSWSTVDDFCVDVLQPLLIKHPKDLISILKKWNRSKNMWKRRASVVVFVRKIGESGLFTQEALQLCENLVFDNEDLVRKGVGWCLKDNMRGDKKKVLNYVKNLRRRGAPATATLYAIRDLKNKERREAMKK